MAGGVMVVGPKRVYEGRTTVYVVVACIIAASGGLIFGYDLGISGIFPFPSLSSSFFLLSFLSDTSVVVLFLSPSFCYQKTYFLSHLRACSKASHSLVLSLSLLLFQCPNFPCVSTRIEFFYCCGTHFGYVCLLCLFRPYISCSSQPCFLIWEPVSFICKSCRNSSHGLLQL